jgi:hypothetical protein
MPFILLFIMSGAGANKLRTNVLPKAPDNPVIAALSWTILGKEQHKERPP